MILIIFLEVYLETSKISAILEDLKKRLKEFNQNEGLLGHEITGFMILCF
jgi:hypothetical protein